MRCAKDAKLPSIRVKPSYHWAVRKTLLVTALYLCVVALHSTAIAWVESRAACLAGTPLYDLAHEAMRAGSVPFSWIPHIPVNGIILALTVLMIGLLVRDERRLVLIRRFFLFHGVMATMRAILVNVTILPTADPACSGRVVADPDLGARALGLTLSAIGIPLEWHGIGFAGNSCCDMIISGHTAMVVALVGMIFMMSEIRWLRLAVSVAAGLALFGLLNPVYHYMVDVLVTVVIGWQLVRHYEQHPWRWLETR